MGYFTYLHTRDNAFAKANVSRVYGYGLTDLLFPPENAVKLPISNPARWQVTDGDGLWFDFPSPVTITAFAIIGHNFSPTASVYLRGGSVARPTGAEYTEFFPWYNEKVLWIPLSTPRTFKHWGLTVSDPANTNGYLTIGYVMAGELTTLPFNFKLGWNWAEEFLNTRGVSQWGRRFTYKGTRIARIKMDFDPLRQDEADTLRNLVRSLDGDGQPMLLIPDRDDLEAVFGRVVSNVTEQRGARVSTSLEFEEEAPAKLVPRAQPFIWNQGDDITALGGVFSRYTSTTVYQYDARGFLHIATDYAVQPGKPRLGHYATAWSDKSLLMETKSTNFLTWSEDLTQGVWAKYGTTAVANAVFAPNGYPVGDRLVEDTANTYHYLLHTFAGGWVTDGHNIAISFFARYYSSRQWIEFHANTGGGFVFAYINVATQQLGYVTPGLTVRLRYMADGWVRIICVFNAGVVTGGAGFHVLIVNGTPPNASPVGGEPHRLYLGDGASGFDLWGFQGETASGTPGILLDATSYMPTAGSIQDRNADLLHFPFPAGEVGAFTIYLNYIERRRDAPFSIGHLCIGHPDTSAPKLLIDQNPGGVFRFLYQNAGGSYSLTASAVPTPIDAQIEQRFILTEGGQVQAGQSINGGPEEICPAAATVGLSAWKVGTWLQLGSAVAGDYAPQYADSAAFKSVKIVRGVQTLDYMRKY